MLFAFLEVSSWFVTPLTQELNAGMVRVVVRKSGRLVLREERGATEIGPWSVDQRVCTCSRNPASSIGRMSIKLSISEVQSLLLKM